MTLNVLDAVRAGAPDAVVVAVASGEVYGSPPVLPVEERAALRPQNPYAVSKASADLLAGFYADAHGLRVVRARAFNHAGPGQAPIYAIATFGWCTSPTRWSTHASATARDSARCDGSAATTRSTGIRSAMFCASTGSPVTGSARPPAPGRQYALR